MRAGARSALIVWLAACAAPGGEPRVERVVPPVAGSTVAGPAAASHEPLTATSSAAPPAATASPGPSRETLCEKALFDLERAAAAPVDKCISPKPVEYPIAVSVRIDESGRIAETKWDAANTTTYGAKASSCILTAVKALPFEARDCASGWLLVRRAPPTLPGGGLGIDSRL